MKSGKRVFSIIIVSLLLISSISLISAGFFGNVKSVITGKAQSPIDQDISLNVLGTNSPVFEVIDAIPARLPLESGVRNLVFGVQISDADVVTDIDDSSITLLFTNIGETDVTGSCSWVSDDILTDTATYSCSIDMEYYYKADDWIVTIGITDFGPGTTVTDTSTTFTYQQLAAMTNSQPALTWPNLAPGTTDQTANENPTTIFNTGNYVGNIKIDAYNLIGTDATPFLASEFTIGPTSGSECTATSMVDSTKTTVGLATRGAGASTDLYYCIPLIPEIKSQAYTTTITPWRIFYEA